MIYYVYRAVMRVVVLACIYLFITHVRFFFLFLLMSYICVYMDTHTYSYTTNS